jgi:hypothetical protein
VTALSKEILELKLEKESLSKKVSGEVNKGSQVHDSLLMSPTLFQAQPQTHKKIISKKKSM